MEENSNIETHFHFGKKEYIINKLPVIILEVCIFIILELILYIFSIQLGYTIDEYNISMSFKRPYYITIIIVTIISYYSLFKLGKDDLLIISKEKFVLLRIEKLHSGASKDPWFAWTSREEYYVTNIQGFYDGLFSYEIYGDIETTKTLKDGSIQKGHIDKLVIKKVFENNNEIAELLNEIAPTYQ